MVRDWIDTPEYDRWRTDPEYRSAEQIEADRQLRITTEGYEAIEDWYERYVVTDFKPERYKPGDTVKWLGPDKERREGTVIGATAMLVGDSPTWIVLQQGPMTPMGRESKIVEVEEIALFHQWGEAPPEPQPVTTSSPSEDDEIPF